MEITFRGMDFLDLGSPRLIMNLEPRAEARAGDDGYGELSAPVAVCCHGIVARLPRVYFRYDDVATFTAQLRTFASNHRGEARLETVAGNRVALYVWSPDLARHAALEVSIDLGKGLGNARYNNQVQVAFLLDPSRWEGLLAALEHLLADTAPPSPSGPSA